MQWTAIASSYDFRYARNWNWCHDELKKYKSYKAVEKAVEKARIWALRLNIFCTITPLFDKQLARQSPFYAVNCKTYHNRLSSLLCTPACRQYSDTAYSDDWTQRRPALDRSHVTHARTRNSGRGSAYNQCHMSVQTTWWHHSWRTIAKWFRDDLTLNCVILWPANYFCRLNIGPIQCGMMQFS